jgi:tyrosyl-tRNA synthetase
LLGKEIPTFPVAAAPRDVFAVIEAVTTGEQALFKSKSEARRALEQGGLYLNGDRLTGNREIAHSELLHGKYLLVKKGARSYGLIVVEGS